VFETNYRFIKLQIGLTPHEHAKQGLYVSLEKITPTLIHFSTLAKGNYFLICIVWPYAQHNHVP
jgi:hypothetical protein